MYMSSNTKGALPVLAEHTTIGREWESSYVKVHMAPQSGSRAKVYSGLDGSSLVRQLPAAQARHVLPQLCRGNQLHSGLQAWRSFLKAGALLVREGVNSGEFYTLLRGWAFRYRTLSNGKRQILNFLLPGDFIGLQEKLGAHSSSGVEVLSDAISAGFPASGCGTCIATTLH